MAMTQEQMICEAAVRVLDEGARLTFAFEKNEIKSFAD
jgi:hypothetical protein